MLTTLFRSFWRVIIFIFGILGTGIIVFKIFPYVDTKLPVYIALLATYSLFAYIFIPTTIRLFRLVIKPNHIPLYVTTPDGWSSDPVNIAIICRTQNQLVRVMKRAGWYTADKATLRNTLRFIIGFIFDSPYPSAPFSSLYLFGRKQDIGFQIPTNDNLSPRHRHHVRFWLLTEEQTTEAHASFWQHLLKFFVRRKKQIWIGAATHDIGALAIRTRNLQVTHQIDSNTDTERDFLIQTLRQSRAIRRESIVQAGKPLRFRGQTFGVNILTDGTLKIIEIKKNPRLIKSIK